MSRRGARAQRLGWGVVDQALVSLTGLAVSVQGAATLPADHFGALATGLAAFYLVQLLVRALVAEVYAVRFAGEAVDRAAAGQAQATTLQFALVAAAVLAAAGFALAGDPGRAAVGGVLAAVGLVAPALLWQDIRRVVFLATGRTRRSALSSAVVLAGQFAGYLVLRGTGQAGPRSLLLAWGAAAALAVVAVPAPGSPWRAGGAPQWLRSGAVYWPRFAVEALAQTGAAQVALLLVAALAGVATLGGIRAATVLLAPLAVVQQAFAQLAVAEARRLAPDAIGRFVAASQLTLLGVGAGWLAAVLLAPRGLVHTAVGASAPAALTAVPGMAAYLIGGALATAPSAGLRVIGALRTGVVLRLSLFPVVVGVPAVVAATGAATGVVAAAFGVVGAVSAAAWTAAAQRSLPTDDAPIGGSDGPAGSVRSATAAEHRQEWRAG